VGTIELAYKYLRAANSDEAVLVRWDQRKETGASYLE